MRCAGGGAAGAGARDEGAAPSHSSALPSAGARGPAELAAGAAPSLLARGSGSGTASGRGGRERAGQRACQVLEEELPADARVEVVPGELLLERPSAEVELGVEAVRRHRRAPHLEAAVLRPAAAARSR